MAEKKKYTENQLKLKIDLALAKREKFYKKELEQALDKLMVKNQVELEELSKAFGLEKKKHGEEVNALLTRINSLTRLMKLMAKELGRG